MALMSLVLRVETSWLRSGCESVESWRDRGGCGVAERGSGMVLMPSLSDCDCDWAVLASCGVDMDRVTWLLGMGDRERSREGVIAPEPWTQGAEWAMKEYSAMADGDAGNVLCRRRHDRFQPSETARGRGRPTGWTRSDVTKSV